MPRRDLAAERDQRQRERSRNLRRAVVASVLLALALSTAFLAGASSGGVAGLFSAMTGQSPQVTLQAAHAKRAELRTGKVLFTLPDGETCRPMYFDNLTGEMSPGTGTVPCVNGGSGGQQTRRFGWGKN